MVSRILLVEDEKELADLYATALSRRGYEVTVATNGRQALEVVQQLQPDVILMDISMPVMDGLTAARQLKQSQLKDIPIVALTSHAMPADVQAGLEAGCDAYIIKPLQPTEIVEELETVLRCYTDEREG